MNLVEEKKAARLEALARRDEAHAMLRETAPLRLVTNFMKAVRVPAGAIVSGYWPGRSELDIRLLMEALHRKGHPIGLPVVTGRGNPLTFREWAPGDALEAKPFGLQEPPASAPEVTPRVLLVPFLAFDRAGYRIGYGAGYYDRTLSKLRAQGTVLAVGVGYSAQQTEHLPHDGHDERLDRVVTEAGAVTFDHAAGDPQAAGDLTAAGTVR